MKKSILLVGVMLLMSSMTLTTAAFDENTKNNFVCFIKYEAIGLSYKYSLYTINIRTQEEVFITSSEKKRDAVNLALSYDRAGACAYGAVKDIKDICKRWLNESE